LERSPDIGIAEVDSHRARGGTIVGATGYSKCGICCIELGEITAERDTTDCRVRKLIVTDGCSTNDLVVGV